MFGYPLQVLAVVVFLFHSAKQLDVPEPIPPRHCLLSGDYCLEPMPTAGELYSHPSPMIWNFSFLREQLLTPLNGG
jgi:hypothetical protein